MTGGKMKMKMQPDHNVVPEGETMDEPLEPLAINAQDFEVCPIPLEDGDSAQNWYYLFPTTRYERRAVCPTIGLAKAGDDWSAVWLKETGNPRAGAFENAGEHPSQDEALSSAYVQWKKHADTADLDRLLAQARYNPAWSVFFDSSGFLMGAGAENERQGSFCGRRFSLVVCVWELRQPVRWTHRFAPDSASLHCAAPVQGAGKFWLGAGVLGKVRA